MFDACLGDAYRFAREDRNADPKRDHFNDRVAEMDRKQAAKNDPPWWT